MTPYTPEQMDAAFWAKVDKTGPVPSHRPDLGECWLWTAYRNKKGYGWFGGSPSPGHLAYHYLVGKAPAGLQWDHLCRTPACVRGSHLEAVTSRENTLRGANQAARQAKQTHCIAGHPFDEENTEHIQGRRRCRACQRRRTREWKERTRVAA